MESLTCPDGVRIAYQRWNTEAAGPPVLLHHGYAASAELNWISGGFVDALAAAGRHVIALDARGHGRSDKPHDPALYGEALMARDVMHLIGSLGVTSYDLVGYSMGAVVSLLVAVQDARVRRLVVGGVGEGVLVCGGVDRRVLPNLELAVALEAEDGAAGAHNPAVAGMRAFVQAVRGDRLALAAQARSVHCQPIALERIAVPTLLLAGDDDPLAMRPELLAGAIPRARLERLRGDHLSALGDPRCLEALLAFLR